MAQRNKIITNLDWITIFIYLLLVLLGWINIYAAVYDEQFKSIADLSQRYGKQLLWIVSAIVIGFFALIIEARFYVFFAYLIYALFIFTLLVVFILGTEVNGAKSWFIISGISIQPSEFAKFASALALAKYISSYNFKMHRLKSLSIIGLILVFPMLLIFLQNDTGSALVYFAFLLVLYREGLSGIVLFFTLLVVLLFIFSLILSDLAIIILLVTVSFLFFYFMNQRIKDFWKPVTVLLASNSFVILFKFVLYPELELATAIMVGSVISAFIFLFLVIKKRLKKYLILILVFLGSLTFTLSVDYFFENVLEPHQQVRINELLGLQSDPLSSGYNVNQSKIAIGSGGFIGKGFLNGTQTKFNFVPKQSTDFIFCTVGEEWGFLGSLFVIGLFMLLFARLIKMAERQRSVFSRVYGYSVVSILFVHFMINIGMTIGLMPVIGIPLPFFSYGGSSLLSFTILLAIFLRLDASRLELFS
jgi:rod shape determining protein RodA